MTIWLLRLPLDIQEEANVTAHETLPLPFGDLPDLSEISSLGKAKRLVKTLNPGDPPETLTGKAERFWNFYSVMAPEDLIAVPLEGQGTMAIAEVVGKYAFENGEHLIPVKWHEGTVKSNKLWKLSVLPLSEITDSDAKNAIRAVLPHSYNRFAKMKWLLGLMFALGLLRMVMQMKGR